VVQREGDTLQHRHERIYIETTRHRISGLLTLPEEGYRSRISDFLNASEREFISLTDCVVELIGHDGPGTRHGFIAVSRHHIVFAIPESGDEPAGLHPSVGAESAPS
jgi:uncharacterized protein DUF6812